MMRFPVKTVWTVALLSLFFIGCPDRDVQSNGSADSSVQKTGDANGGANGAAPRPSGGRPGLASTIPFSGDKEKIRKKMEMISGAEMRLDTASAAEGALSYKGGRFGGFPVVDWTFLFHKGQMMFAQVNYGEDQAGVSADSVFNAMTTLLSKQYGEPIIDSRNRISRPLSPYTEGAQEFIAKVGKALPQDFKLWTAAEDAAYVITLNKVQWNTAGGQTFVHLAFYDRALSESHFASTGE